MGTIAWIVGIILILMFAMAGMVKVTDHKMAIEVRTRLGLGKGMYQLIGVAELLGVLGLLVGLVRDGKSLEWAGPLAAVGLFATMVGAIFYHNKAKDEPKESIPAVMMAMLSVVYFVTIIAR